MDASDSTTSDRDLNTNEGAARRGFSDAEVVGEERQPAGDLYCGNCAHFEYVRTERGLRPYCAYHEDLMDDMDACESWTKRGQ